MVCILKLVNYLQKKCDDDVDQEKNIEYHVSRADTELLQRLVFSTYTIHKLHFHY